jgi:rRNA maturation RNase YbeY
VDKIIVGDIFISIDRIRENAIKFNSGEVNELHRVIIHGALHLLGYQDKKAESKKIMTQKEDHYLDLRNFT